MSLVPPSDTAGARTTSATIVLHVLIFLAAVLVLVTVLRSGWRGDVVGLAMPVVLASSFLVAATLVFVRPSWCIVPVAVVLVSAFVIVAPRWPARTAAPVDPLRLAAVNLQFDSGEAAAGVRDAVAVGADVLVVSELTPVTDEMLRVAYPYRVVSADLLHSRFGEGVYATVPLTALATPPGITDQLLRVAVGAVTPFVVYAVHLPRPTFDEPAPAAMISFDGQRAAAFALDRAVDAEQGPVVISGDLNLSDRTSGYRKLAAGRVDATRTGWAGSTYKGSLVWRLLLLRIDHIFLPADWCSRDGSTFQLSGSDHDGVAATIGRCP
ncbi:MAG: endonuclease/exonuclease/phosphatase family protein [Ilumatobacteraceae bacterium]